MPVQPEKKKAAEPEMVEVRGVVARHLEPVDKTVGTPNQLLAPEAAPPAQMVKVREIATGRVFAAWPVDARELVTHPDRGHEYADAKAEFTKGAADVSGNPIPVTPKSGQSPVAVDPIASPAPAAEKGKKGGKAGE